MTSPSSNCGSEGQNEATCEKTLKNMQFLHIYGTRLAVLLVLLLLVLLHLSKRSPMISKYSKKNMPVIYEVILGAWLNDVGSCQGGNYLYNKE